MSTTRLWANFSEDEKQYFRGMKVTFVLAPRDMSEKRVIQIVKSALSQGNVVFGIAEEPFITGFEGQPQFQTLAIRGVEQLAQKVATAKVSNNLHILQYPQNEADVVIRALRPNKVLVVRGSYLYAFHNRSTYRLLQKRNIPFDYVSPFVDESEAQEYEQSVSLPAPNYVSNASEEAIFKVVDTIAMCSYDYSFQVGAVLAQRKGSNYSVVDAACNEVVPYQTHALHFGNAREDNTVAPQSSSSHYDTIHAEMNLLVRSMQNGVTFSGKSLFINMLPCPNCARTLVKTGLEEVVYLLEYSDGYSQQLFNQCGIKTRRYKS